MISEGLILVFLSILIAVLIGMILFQAKQMRQMADRAESRERDLLDRIMARDYATYVQAEVVRADAKKALTPEEIYEQQVERGIPV